MKQTTISQRGEKEWKLLSDEVLKTAIKETRKFL